MGADIIPLLFHLPVSPRHSFCRHFQLSCRRQRRRHDAAIFALMLFSLPPFSPYATLFTFDRRRFAAIPPPPVPSCRCFHFLSSSFYARSA